MVKEEMKGGNKRAREEKKILLQENISRAYKFNNKIWVREDLMSHYTWAYG